MKKNYSTKLIGFFAVLVLFTFSSEAQTTYYWVGGANGDFTASDSWNTNLNGSGSNRATAAIDDHLIFDGSNIGGTTPTTGTVTPLITASFNIGQLHLLNAATVVLQRDGAGTTSFIVMGEGTAAHDITVSANSSLKITTFNGSGLNFIIGDPGNTEASAAIAGTVTIMDGGAGTARISAINPASLIFQNGSVLNSQMTAASSYPFGSASSTPATAVGGVVFESGAVCKFLGGNSVQSNTANFFPIKWNAGSTLEMYAAQPAGLFGSKYLANVKVKTGVNITLTDNSFGMDTLTIENGAAFNYRTTGTLPIRGDIINNGTFGAAAGFTSSNLVLIGTVPQRVTGSGTFNNLGTLSVGTNAEVTLFTNVATSGTSTSNITGKLNAQTFTTSGTGALQFRTAAKAVSTASFTTGLNTITIVPGNATAYGSANVTIGGLVTGDGIAPNTYIISTSSGTFSFNVSKPVTATASSGAPATITIENFAPTLATANANGTDGTITNSGTRTFSVGMQYIFNGVTAAPFSTSTNNAAGDVTINANVTSNKTNQNISGTLTLGAAKLTIRSTDTVRITSGNEVAGAPFSISKYIVSEVVGTNAGVLRMDAMAAPRNLPIGSATNYLPIMLAPVSSSDFAVSLFEGVTSDGTLSGTPFSAEQKKSVVDAVWTINRPNGTGDCSVTLNWPSSLEGTDFSSFANDQIGVGKNTAGTWDIVVGSGDNVANTATGTFSTFSPFGVGRLGISLPIYIKDVQAKLKAGGVEIAWNVLNEEAGTNFVLERSSNGNDFSSVGSIKGFKKNSYSYMDVTAVAKLIYYRIKVISANGSARYSAIISVKQGGNADASVYPNPVTNTLIVSGLNRSTSLTISNTLGQIFLQQKTTSNSISMDVSSLKPGIYVIQIAGENEQTINKTFLKK